MSVRTRPLGAAQRRPIGAVAAPGMGTGPSNHEATAINLQERGVMFETSALQSAPGLAECEATFRAALPNIDSEWIPDTSQLVEVLETSSKVDQGRTKVKLSLISVCLTLS